MQIGPSELRWLSIQNWPVWGGHLARKEPAHFEIQIALQDGLIERNGDGYVITDLGRSKAAS